MVLYSLDSGEDSSLYTLLTAKYGLVPLLYTSEK